MIVLDVHIKEMWRDSWCLRDQKLLLKKGESFSVKGPNGYGKTSILLGAAGLLPFNGHRICGCEDEMIRLKLMHLDGDNDATVIDHLMMWAIIYRADYGDVEKRMGLYNLSKYKNDKLRNLSFGNSQKLSLSRLGLGKSFIWLIDEPFSGLDNDGKESLKQDVVNFLGCGGAVCFAEPI